MSITRIGKKMLSFFAVFFLTLCIVGCNFSGEVSDREGVNEAKENVEWLLTNFKFGEIINDKVKEPVVGNVKIIEPADGKVSENDLRNNSYSGYLYGMSATFESSNPEIMKPQWVTYKKRAYVYGDPANPEKITGIETKETKILEFVVNRPEANEEDVEVAITINVTAPYQVGDQTYYQKGSRTLIFNVTKKAETNTMSVGQLEDYILANWADFNAGTLFKDENGNALNVSIEGVVTEQVWGDGYDNHSFTMADDQGNGIYIYGPQNPVNIGDRVIVTGQPAYYNGTIQIGLKSTVEVISEASEYVAPEETTIEEWYAKYPAQDTNHKIPGQRVKLSGLFIQKTVDGYTNYAIQSTESDHFIQIYYKSYGTYEEELLKGMLGKAAEFELAMYYCHSNGYWVGILNNYDYQPTLIEMSAEDKLTADVAGIKPVVTVKDGEKVELPTGTLENGSVLSGWTADKEGYINLESLVASLNGAKEDVKVTLTATATNGEFSQEVKVEVTIKYTKAEIAEKTVKELIDLKEEMLETFKVTGTVVQWGNKIGTPDEAPTMYGNFILEGEDGSQIVVYGSTASEAAIAWDAANSKYKYTNQKDFLTNELTNQIKLGDKVQLLVLRTSYNGNPQLNAVVLAVNPEQGGTQEPTFGVVTTIKENVAYKLGFAHLNAAVLGKEYFLTGEMDGYYGATVEDHTQAADIYFIAVEGGYQIKLVKADGSIVYVNAVASGTHTNIQFADTATSVWTLNTELNTLVTTVGSAEFLLGTRSDKTYTTIGPVAMTYASTTCIVHVYGGSVVTPEPPVHEHKFVEGKCECGEVDPNYQPPTVEPTFGVLTEIKENVAYKLGFAHLNAAVLGKEYFLTGEMDGYYGATVEDHTKAADIYFIAVEGGYQIKLVKADGSIVYVNAVASGTHTNIQFADTATSVWTLNTELNTLVTTVGSAEFLLGTRSDKTYTTIGPVAMTYASTTCIVHVYGESVVTPEPPVHEHKFVEGKCECGEVDPNYQPSTQEPAVSNKTVAELIALSEEMNASYKVTGKVVLWGNKLTSTDTAPTMYGNFVLEGEDGSKIVVYGATASASALVWNAETGKYTYTNAKDFLTNATTSAIALGDTVELLVVRTSYNSNPQLNAIVLKVTPAAPEHEHNFVEGKCECGEVDPNYQPPVVGPTEQATVTAKISDVAAANGWTNGVMYNSFNLNDKVSATLKAEGGSGSYAANTGKYYTSGTNWRMYQSDKNATLTIAAIEGCVIVSVKVSYTVSNNGTLVLNGTNIATDTVVEVNANSVVFTAGNTGSATNGQVRITAIEVVYATAGGETPEPPVHEHNFVEGKCECGEVDPNYQAPSFEEPAVSNKTVAELITLSEEMNASYKVTGKVVLWGNKLTSTDTAPTMYGNFVLEGEDGSKIVVYGATASASALVWNAETGKYTYTNAKDFLTNATTSAIALGDTVELLVVRTSYNSNPQLNAIVLNVTPAAPEHEHNFVEGKCECGEVDPNYVAPEVPEVSANKADLDTMGTKSSSYSDRTSKSGWTATYAALNCGGTTDINPQFKVFGTENDFALTIAGGTDMVGKITSPVLNNGLSKLSFNYTKLFTDTTLSVTVYIKDVEGNVLYQEVITYEAEKTEKYVLKTYELVLETPIQGDFVIEIVNNCPTGVTGKKDRISIWNITWENAPKHEHEFVEGKCECGEEDPNYIPPQAEPELFLTVGFDSYANSTSAKASVTEGGVTFKTNSVNKMYTDNTPGSIALKFNNSSSSNAGFEATGFEKAIVKMTFKAATWNSAVTFTIVGTTADGQSITIKVDLANTAKAFAADEIVVEFEVPVVSFTFAASKRAFIDNISFYG